MAAPSKDCFCFSSLLKKYFANKLELSKAFCNDELARRKFALTSMSKHMNKDKFEPAPLLNKTLLDIGCGTSNIPGELTLRGADVTAIDHNAEVLNQAKQKAEKSGMMVEYEQKSIEDLIAEGIQFDFINCLDVLEYVKDTEDFMAKVKKLLKTDGMLIINGFNNSITSKLLFGIWAKRIAKLPPYLDQPTHNFHSLQFYKNILQKNGMTCVYNAGLSFNPNNLQWEKCESDKLRFMAAFKIAL